MGVSLNVRGADFLLRKRHFDEALAAVKAATPIGRHVSWVKPEDVQAAETLPDALWAWGWEAVCDNANEDMTFFDGEDGDITGLIYEGEKAGDEDRLFEALAPYVESGSFIECQYDDEVMRYVFRRGRLKNVRAKLMWPGDM